MATSPNVGVVIKLTQMAPGVRPVVLKPTIELRNDDYNIRRITNVSNVVVIMTATVDAILAEELCRQLVRPCGKTVLNHQDAPSVVEV